MAINLAASEPAATAREPARASRCGRFARWLAALAALAAVVAALLAFSPRTTDLRLYVSSPLDAAGRRVRFLYPRGWTVQCAFSAGRRNAARMPVVTPGRLCGTERFYATPPRLDGSLLSRLRALLTGPPAGSHMAVYVWDTPTELDSAARHFGHGAEYADGAGHIGRVDTLMRVEPGTPYRVYMEYFQADQKVYAATHDEVMRSLRVGP